MRIDELTLEGFRNYDTVHLTFDGDCNVIYGENAQGKTNLLEAIVYLSCGKSPRTHTDRELIGFDRDFARLTGLIHSRDRDFKTEITLPRGRLWCREERSAGFTQLSSQDSLRVCSRWYLQHSDHQSFGTWP